MSNRKAVKLVANVAQDLAFNLPFLNLFLNAWRKLCKNFTARTSQQDATFTVIFKCSEDPVAKKKYKMTLFLNVIHIPQTVFKFFNGNLESTWNLQGKCYLVKFWYEQS